MILADDVRQFAIEKPETDQAQALKKKTYHHADSFQTINGAHFEVHAGRFRKVPGLDRDFINFESHVDRLGNHLRIENKIIGVQEKWDGRQKPAAVCAKAAVAIR